MKENKILFKFRSRGWLFHFFIYFLLREELKKSARKLDEKEMNIFFCRNTFKRNYLVNFFEFR